MRPRPVTSPDKRRVRSKHKAQPKRPRASAGIGHPALTRQTNRAANRRGGCPAANGSPHFPRVGCSRLSTLVCVGGGWESILLVNDAVTPCRSSGYPRIGQSYRSALVGRSIGKTTGTGSGNAAVNMDATSSLKAPTPFLRRVNAGMIGAVQPSGSVDGLRSQHTASRKEMQKFCCPVPKPGAVIRAAPAAENERS